MNKLELESLLEELDEALVKAFPGPEPMSVLVVRHSLLWYALPSRNGHSMSDPKRMQ